MSDSWITDRFPEIVHAGDTVFDVGAHKGVYTEILRKLVGDTGKVYAFELNPDNSQKLVNEFSSYDNVIINNVAVSDHNGEVDFYKGKDTFTWNIIGHDTSYKSNACAGKIKSLRLDTFYDGPIDFMKIDVEGAELKVLQGCQGIIHNVKQMLVECHLNKEWPELRDLILGFGFICHNLLTNELITLDSDRPYQCLCKRENK